MTATTTRSTASKANRFFLLFFGLIAGCSEPDVSASPDESLDLIISDVTVVDTLTGNLAPNQVIVIVDGMITQIIATESAPPHGSAIHIEATGMYVVPGFLDMHAHPLNVDEPAVDLSVMLANGITGYRQMSATAESFEKYHDRSAFSVTDAPELLLIPGGVLFKQLARSPEAVVEVIREQHAMGGEFVKMVDADPATFHAALDEAKRFGLPMVGHVPISISIAEAAKSGMQAIEHLGPVTSLLLGCSSAEKAYRQKLAKAPTAAPPVLQNSSKAISNPLVGRGVPAIELMQQLSDTYSEEKCARLAEVLVATGNWQIPTLIRAKTMQFGDDPQFVNDPNLRYVPEVSVDMWRTIAQEFSEKIPSSSKETLARVFELQLDIVKLFDQAGVKMLTGTDIGGQWVIPGASLHQEFDLLEQAGLSPLTVLQMTTINGAAFLGREATMRSVEVGKRADLVLLDANPVDSIQNLHSVYAVVRSGKYFSSDALAALKASAENR